MESNDSPEIPDKGETSDIPGLPSGGPSMADKNGILFQMTGPVSEKAHCPWNFLRMIVTRKVHESADERKGREGVYSSKHNEVKTRASQSKMD